MSMNQFYHLFIKIEDTMDLDLCDEKTHLPMAGTVDSLNVNVDRDDDGVNLEDLI